MKVKLKEISVAELAAGYKDDANGGVVGYAGKLDIRPPYQREFVYKDAQRDAVIDTVKKGFPLNVMYWAVREDGNFEIIDGQQRSIAICRYVHNKFFFDELLFDNLQDNEQAEILNYKLTVYLCSGTDSEKLQWFETINIAGVELTHQELRNAVYSGPWVTDAKKYFSKNGCAAYEVGKDYLKGVAIRQDYLETAIKWHTESSVEEYMGKHQHDAGAKELWNYFNQVIAWVQKIFPKYRRQMQGVAWGDLYKQFCNKNRAADELERQVAKLMADDDVTKKAGIYPYVLNKNERHLSLRSFTDSQKTGAYERQNGVCLACDKHFRADEMEADHITPWHEGGKTVPENCQMLCKPCNRSKGGK